MSSFIFGAPSSQNLTLDIRSDRRCRAEMAVDNRLRGGENIRMPHQLSTSYLQDSIGLFRYYKKLADRAMAQCPDEALFHTLDAESNSIAIIVKHMSGNMRSRWRDFLTTDGEKPDRKRDTEFEAPASTRAELIEQWERGWKYRFRCARTADGSRTHANRDDSYRTTLRHASHQPADCPLRAPRWPDFVSRQASDFHKNGKVGIT